LIFAPYSRTSYLDAIFESVGNYLILTNNGFLAASRSGGYPRPFTRPIYSTRGTHDGYNARFVPYFNSSDHMCFVEGIIGVPAVATINWDDLYIHSSDDDLYQIDQTQLHRNQFLMGAMAYVLAFADEHTVPLLAAEAYAQGQKRLANDLQMAFQYLDSRKDSVDTGIDDAHLLIEEGMKRETRALTSIEVFSRDSKSNDLVIKEIQWRRDRMLQEFRGDVDNYYHILHSTNVPLGAGVDSSKQPLYKKIPMNPISLKTYFENRGKVIFRGNLHALMRDEVYNFVDGKRSYYDIYKAVRAEQLAAGTWYYGDVTLDDVVKLLDAAVEAKALVLK
jgi:hypothetical protein